MTAAVQRIDASLGLVWSRDPGYGLDVDDLRERVADLELLLPQVAEQADTFFYADMPDSEHYRALYEGFALHSLLVMLDMRALYVARDLVGFLLHLEDVSRDVYELCKYVEGVDVTQRAWLRRYRDM